MNKLLITAVTTTLASHSVLAHEGHHEAGLSQSVWHLFTQPDHWLILAGVVAVATLAIRSIRKHINKKATAKTN